MNEIENNKLWHEICILREEIRTLNQKTLYLQEKIDKIKVILYE